MIKREVSPPSPELPTTAVPPAASSSSSARFASFRGALQRRSSTYSASARVCVLVAALLCLVFLLAEVNETSSISLESSETPAAAAAASASASALAVDGEDVTYKPPSPDEKKNKPPSLAVKDEDDDEVGPPKLVGGLRRFGSFEEYVEVSRAEGGSSVMPLVSLNGKDVTLPSVIIVGGQRTGTSTLFSMLSQHEDVGSLEPDPVPLQKKSRGFMAQDPESYPHEAEWPGDKLGTDLPASVLGRLLEEISRPYTVSEGRREGVHTRDLVTTSLNPGYLASLLAPYRLQLALPNVKIVMVVRDPVDRYFSELRDILCVQDEVDIDWEDITVSFAMPKGCKDYLSKAVVDYSPYDKKCLGEGATAADLWACQVGLQESHRPLFEGMYATQLQRWQRVFGEKPIHVVESSRLFQEPEMIAKEVAKFAGLGDEHHVFFEFAVDREASCDPRRRSSTVSAAYSDRKVYEPNLRKWYAEHNDIMSDLVTKDLHWNDRIRSAYHDPKS